MTTLHERSLHVPVPLGRIFVRSWHPESAGDEAEPILLFHDSLGCVALWRDFPAALARATARPVIAYDRLGFGQSDPHPGRLDVGFVAAEARDSVPALREHLRIGRFVACGHSVGGGMVVETAARFPEDCTALVTIGAQAFVEDRTLDGIRKAKEDFAQPENLARLAKYHGDKAAWVVQAWTGSWLSPAFASWNLDAALARLRCPILAIHGELDEYGSTEHPRRLAARRGTARVLQGIGHVPHREAQETVLEAMCGFLDGGQGR